MKVLAVLGVFGKLASACFSNKPLFGYMFGISVAFWGRALESHAFLAIG
jgi:hypothetical protein